MSGKRLSQRCLRELGIADEPVAARETLRPDPLTDSPEEWRDPGLSAALRAATPDPAEPDLYNDLALGTRAEQEAPDRAASIVEPGLDENLLFVNIPDDDIHYEYEATPEREPILFVRWDHMWDRIRAALTPDETA